MTNTYCVYTVSRYFWWCTVDMSETCRVLYQINVRNSASRWLSLSEYITMHGPVNVKNSSNDVFNTSGALYRYVPRSLQISLATIFTTCVIWDKVWDRRCAQISLLQSQKCSSERNNKIQLHKLVPPIPNSQTFIQYAI